VKSEADILNELNLGASVAILNNEPQSPLGELLISISEDVIDQLKGKLNEYNINTSSGGLSQSIQATLEQDGDAVTVKTSADFYWRYVNYGVNGTELSHGAPSHGTAPPGELSFLESIKQWIPQRGIQLPPQFSSFDSFSYAIMTNVIRNGKEARPFFSDVVNASLVQTIRGPIERVMGKAIKIRIVEPWQKK